jgi:serine protease Do
LVVEEVHVNGSRAELRPGDIILTLIARGENTELRTVDQFNKLLAQFDKAANITLLVKRGELQTFVTLKGMPDKKAE